MNKKKSKKTIANDKPKKFKRRPDAYTVHIVLVPTEEHFMLGDVYNDMTIAQLKDDLEFITGIPVNLQRLSYLDDGELQDHTTVRSNEFVPGSTVQLKVWPMYQELIEAIVSNEIDWVFKLGVTHPADYHTPASDYMTKRARKAWLEERAFIALCLAAHRGHQELAQRLIENGADVIRTTPTGKTALHLASATGHGELVNLLLKNGADINAEDQNGNTALSVAERFGSKVCSRYLFQFQWQERAKDVKPSKKVPMFAHQYHDSSFPVWKRGNCAQIYVQKILRPGEFEGTSLHAPKGGRHPTKIKKEIRNRTFFNRSPDSNASELDDYFPDETGVSLPPINKKKIANMKRPLTYDEWLSQQKAIERKIAAEKKLLEDEDNRKKLDEEDKKKEEVEKMDYEKWLKQQQQDKVVVSAPGPGGAASAIDRSPRFSSPSKTRAATAVQDLGGSYSAVPGTTGPAADGALRLYLRSLGRSKAGVNYEDWLDQKEMEISQLVRQKELSAVSG